MRHCLLCFLLMIARGLSAAEQDAGPTTIEPVGSIIHDLRDFLPEAESSTGKSEDPIPAFSVKPGGYWVKYKPYNKNGSGCLSRTELQAVVADLVTTLRDRYPDEYSAIDADGHETITNAKLQAYLQRKR